MKLNHEREIVIILFMIMIQSYSILPASALDLEENDTEHIEQRPVISIDYPIIDIQTLDQQLGQLHDIIRINNNTGFNVSNGVTAGDGSKDKPYIIENLNINATNNGSGVYIGNTTAYFKLRNCTVHNASGNSGAYYYDTGIVLYNVTNATLDNNTAIDNLGRGIYLFKSINCTMRNNKLIWNYKEGILLEGSDRNILLKNNVSWNNKVDSSSYAGLHLKNSDHNELEWNYISNNSEFGLKIAFSDHNDIVNNQVVFNCGGDAGILISSAIDNKFISNNISNGTGDGVQVSDSYDNIFKNNTIFHNIDRGIWIANGYNNSLIENYIADNKYGISIYMTDKNRLIYNTISGNNEHGIQISGTLDDCVNNLIENNTISNNKKNGIYFGSARAHNNNVIKFNSLINNSGYGIYIGSNSYSNLIHHNNFNLNNMSGLQGFDSNGNNNWNDSKNRGNYWDNYTNLYPIAVNDGFIWNISYDLVGGAGAKDYYPLVYPVEFDPPMLSDKTVSPGTTGDYFNVRVSAYDNTNVSKVFIFYWFGTNINEAFNTSMEYNEISGFWEATLQIPMNSLKALKYNISAVDSNNNWRSIQRTISVIDNDPPNANAGEDKEIFIDDDVDFNGLDSDDNIGIVNYTWHFYYNNLDIYLFDGTPEFVFEFAGDYLVELKVFDAKGNYDNDALWVNVTDNKKPKIQNLDYPLEVYIDEPMEISVLVYDPSGINSIMINYSDVTGETNNISMNKQTSNDWYYTIPGQAKTGEVKFFIWISDGYGNWDRTNIYFIDIIDSVLPELLDIKYNSKSEIGLKIPITVFVNDNVGISTVKLNYTGTNGTNYNVSMSSVGGANYSYIIPKQNKPGTLNFYIWVVDTFENWNRSESLTIKIISKSVEKTQPMITWVSIPTETNVGKKIKISVLVQDKYDIENVFLNYTDVNRMNYNVTMILSGNNTYSHTLPAQSEAGIIYLFIAAVNINCFWNRTLIRPIEVIKIIRDNNPPFVIATTPKNGSSGVKIDFSISIFFNESMDISTVEASLQIEPQIDYKLSWRDNNILLKLDFPKNLSYETTYIITIGLGAKDLAGNQLKKPFKLYFTTEKAPPPDIDVDNDQIPNDWELENGLNPNDPNDASADFDFDGLANFDEYIHRTNLLNHDSDGDGMPDGWEVDYGLNPLVNDSYDDLDNDGYSNLEEYKSNTLPNDSNSIPKEEKEKEDNYVLVIIAITVVIIVIILLLALLIRRTRGPELDKVGEPSEGEIEDEAEEAGEEHDEDEMREEDYQEGEVETEEKEDKEEELEIEAEEPVQENEVPIDEEELEEKEPIEESDALSLEEELEDEAELEEDEGEIKDTEFECPDCGATMGANVTACPVCGSEINKSNQEE